MSSEETATSELTEPSPPDESQQRESSPEGTDWRAETTRLRQQLKHTQDINRQALAHVQRSLTLERTPGGDVIIEKLNRIIEGDTTVTLTAAEEKKVAEQVQAGAGTPDMSEERAQQLLDASAQKFEQRMWESRKAEKAMDVLNEWAAKEFPGYEKFHKTDEWNENLGDVLDKIKDGRVVVPAGEDPYQFAIARNYSWLKSLNPDIGKEKPSKKSEKDRREAISQSSVQAGGVAPEDSDSLPDYARLDIAPRGATGGGGRPFGSLKRT